MSRKKGKNKIKGRSKASRPMAKISSFRPHASPSHRAPDAMARSTSLADEARWSGKHRTVAFDASRKLRHLPVHFVSAGFLHGTMREALRSTDTSFVPAGSLSPPPIAEVVARLTLNTRSPSPAPSACSSNTDQVVFTGRGQPQVKISQTVELTDRSICAPEKPSLAAGPGPDSASSQRDTDLDSDAVVEDQFMKRRRGRPAWEGTVTPWEHRSKPGIGWQPHQQHSDLDALPCHPSERDVSAMEDYIQNAEELDLVSSMSHAFGFAHRDMDLDDGNTDDETSESESQEESTEVAWSHDHVWASTQHFDHLSTSSDMLDTVACILSKRTRESGLHYLCVYQGSASDDAHWLPSASLTSPGERRLIEAFEEELLVRERRNADGRGTRKHADYETCEMDDEADTSALNGKDCDMDDDEAIARFLQEQEELGLHSDDFLLPGDDAILGGLAGTLGRRKRRQQARGGGSRNTTFPSASEMADVLARDSYDDFDIMDTEGLSLKTPRQAYRLEFDQQLQDAWQMDRAKKKARKVERELLRQQGLLGRAWKKADLGIKFPSGMYVQDVVDEICEFLLGDTQSLALPPMESRDRANVHQISRYFDLTSRSRGVGRERFTLLAKNSRTRMWTRSELDAFVQGRNFLRTIRHVARLEKSTLFANRSATRVKGRPPLARAGYKDGETVGAKAAKLGPENKGHVLLEKMGWSKGSGLGAQQTGILEPIAHKMKTNRTGV